MKVRAPDTVLKITFSSQVSRADVGQFAENHKILLALSLAIALPNTSQCYDHNVLLGLFRISQVVKVESWNKHAYNNYSCPWIQ